MRLYGKQPVIERLRANPVSFRKIYIQEGFQEASYIHSKSKRHGIPVIVIPKTKILKLARNTSTQGVLADVDDFLYTDFNELLDTALDKKQVVVFLDELTDPQNLGAIIRSLACLGAFSLVLPSHHSVEITDSVLRVACGGENYISIAKISSLQKGVRKAKELGFTIVGAVVTEGSPLEDAQLSFPLGLVVGSEEKGISKHLLAQVDLPLTIKMRIHTMSLNVAHATSMFCYEIKRQLTDRYEKK